MMKCGCAANATCSSSGGVKFDPPIPSCVIHECLEIADKQPDLTGRTAKCAYCNSLEPSSMDLAFFEHTPQKATDGYYCGCRGWD